MSADWEYLYGELLQSTADQKGMIDYLEERRAALEAEVERLRVVVEAALLMRSACPMDWTHGDCRDSQCAVVCCALAALDEEVGE